MLIKSDSLGVDILEIIKHKKTHFCGGKIKTEGAAGIKSLDNSVHDERPSTIAARDVLRVVDMGTKILKCAYSQKNIELINHNWNH